MSCPSICPSTHLSVRHVRSRNSKTKKCRKIKIGVDVPHGTSKWSANFQFERSEVKVTGRKTPKSGVIFTYGRRIKRSRRRLHTRPTPLLGLLYCRCLRPWTTGRTASHNVGVDISCYNKIFTILIPEFTSNQFRLFQLVNISLRFNSAFMFVSCLEMCGNRTET